MTALREVRVSIAQVLQGAGINSFGSVPEVATPPFAYAAPGGPAYVTRDGATFGGEIVTTEVVLIASPGLNDVQADELDQMILTAVDALDATDQHIVRDVDQPGRVALNGNQHLAAAIRVTTEIHRT